MKLSIIVPAYNEIKTIEEIIGKVKKVDIGQIEKEIIIVDDGSTDGTRDVLEKMDGVKIIFHEKNCGKGGALKTGFMEATGDMVIIQDADLEYDPEDYKTLLKPILDKKADVVYGSRFRGEGAKRMLYIMPYYGNKLLTMFSNLISGLRLTDMETCYKVFTREVVDSFKDKLESKRFGIEPELTARVARGKWKIVELPINYYGRTYEDGKKIGWKDGMSAVWCIIYFNLLQKN